MRTPCTTRSAFTLLELLVALVLMNILAASLYAGLHIAHRARDQALERLQPVRTAELTADLIRRELEAALPPTGIMAGAFIGEDGLDQAGRDSDILTFSAATNVVRPGERAGDLREVTLALLDSEGTQGSALVRLTSTNLLAPEEPEPVEDVLCRGVRSFNLRYFDGSDWLEVWDSTAVENALPAAVEVTLGIDGRPDPVTGSEEHEQELCRVVLMPCYSVPGSGVQVNRGTGTGGTGAGGGGR